MAEGVFPPAPTCVGMAGYMYIKMCVLGREWSPSLAGGEASVEMRMGIGASSSSNL